MSNLSEVTPWSNSTNAPDIPNWLYLGEKAYFTGFVIDATLYGIVIVLFFRCISAFFDPVNRAMVGIKWGLVVHTIAMFLIATAYIVMTSHIQFMSFIENRQFHTPTNGMPGPIEYQFFIHSKAIVIAPATFLLFNNWLSSGLLLYRCYCIYEKSCWAVVFPFLMYLTSLVVGVLYVYESSQPNLVAASITTMVPFDVPFFSISFALNILVTILIVTRLILKKKKIQNAMSGAVDIGGSYMAIIAIIVESYAICAIAVTLYLATWGARSPLQCVFLQIIAQMQVIAPFLVTLRIANRRAFIMNNSVSTDSSSVHFWNRGRRRSDTLSLPNSRYTISSMDTGEIANGDVIMIGPHHSDDFSDSKESLKT